MRLCWRTKSLTNGGGIRSAGRRITTSGSRKDSRLIPPHSGLPRGRTATGSFATAAASQLRAITPRGNLEVSQRSISLFFAQHLAGRAAFQSGDYAAAERAEREALAARKIWGTQAIPDQRDLGEVSTWLALALVRQGKSAEAAQLIGPVVKFQRELAARNHGDQWLPIELASALYAQGLVDAQSRAAHLREAATLLDAAPVALRNVHDVRHWRERIAAAQGAG